MRIESAPQDTALDTSAMILSVATVSVLYIQYIQVPFLNIEEESVRCGNGNELLPVLCKEIFRMGDERCIKEYS